jgi:lipopolysaccharide/colanic/teichoic acid biosynthesis glycosyltransferase
MRQRSREGDGRAEHRASSDGHRIHAGPVRKLRTKRAFDVVFAALVLLAVLPIFVIIAVAIKLDSPGPIFYRVRRAGYGSATLMMLKFRKMRDDATGSPLTGEHDPRLTRVGRFLTAARLDELPQFWDVLRGRMSVVGPRPEDPGFVALHPDEYAVIHAVRPGITGLSQLAYAEERRIVDDEDPISDYIRRILPQKLRLDQVYARTCSVRLDLAIIRWTIATVLFGVPVAVNRSTGGMNVRRRRQRDAATARRRLAAAPAAAAITGAAAAHGESDESPLPRRRAPSSHA